MEGQVPGGRNQATVNKTRLNADNEDDVMILGEEKWEDLIASSMEIQALMGFDVDHQMKMILVLTITIRKDKHGQRH